jgi:hypothetical protein
MTLDDDAFLSYDVLCNALRYVGHSPTSGSWQNQGWRATSHQVSKMNQVKPLISVESTITIDVAIVSLQLSSQGSVAIDVHGAATDVAGMIFQ